MSETPPITAVPHSPGFFQETWMRFRRRRTAMVALVVVGCLTLVALLSPVIVGAKPIVCRYKGQLYFPALSYFNAAWENPYLGKELRKEYTPIRLHKKDPQSWAMWPLNYNDPNRRIREGEWPNRPENPRLEDGVPSGWNWFGTDSGGVDVFAKMVHGTRTALLVGFVSMGIAAAIGISIGALSGYFGGWVDMVLSRATEVVMCVPTLILILAMMSIIERPTIWHTMAVLGLTGWTTISRLTRGEFLRLKQSDFVAAAKVLGCSPLRIVFLHILPNALAPVLVPITFGIASAILLESSLSYLGFGAPAPNPSWGSILREGQKNHTMWWLIVFPGLAIFASVLSYNLIGEGLQEATDPRLRDGHK